MLIATWNVNSLNARLPRVLGWLEEIQPDVLCMQETKMADHQFPAEEFEALGYKTAHHGEGRWNGVAILSRVGLTDVVNGFQDGREPDPDARVIWATCDGVRIASVYVPNGRELNHDHYVYKLDWLSRLRSHLDQHHQPSEEVAVLGDWNVTPTDDDVWSREAFEGLTHVSQPERDALQNVKSWGFVDTLRERYSETGLFTFWDYRNGDFHKRRGMRIDFVYSSEPLAKHCVADLIDRNARKGPKPSDHAPVLAAFERNST